MSSSSIQLFKQPNSTLQNIDRQLTLVEALSAGVGSKLMAAKVKRFKKVIVGENDGVLISARCNLLTDEHMTCTH